MKKAPSGEGAFLLLPPALHESVTTQTFVDIFAVLYYYEAAPHPA